MRRFFVQNIFFLILVNLIVKPLWIFGIDRNVQIAVGHEAYGQYVALLNFSIIFQVLLDFGLQSYNNRTVAQSPQAMKGLFPNVIIAKSLLSAGYLLLVMLLGFLLGYGGYALLLLFALCFVQIFTSLLLYLRSNISALHHFRTDSLLSVADRLFMIAICSLLLFHPSLAPHFRIEWFVYAQIAAYLFSALIAFFICTRFASLDWRHYDLRKVWAICRQSFPYALLIFLMAIYIRSDVFLLERLLPNGREAGIYASAYRFLDVANNVTGVLFAGILLPLFGRMLAKKEPVGPLVRLSANLLVPLALTAMITAFFFGEDIMRMQLKGMAADYGYEGNVFSLLMAAFPGYCIGYVYMTLITANGNLDALIRMALVAVVLNVGLNLALVPAYGAWGAALTCCITQTYLSVYNILLARKKLQLHTDWPWVARYLLFAGLVLLVCLLVRHLELPLWPGLAVISAGAVSAMLLCGFLSFRKIGELFRNK